MSMMALVGACWFAANILLLQLLRPRDGFQERLIVSFPGAWIVVGLPLTVSFGASGMLLVRGLFFS
jgi:hypothetical protein